MTLGILSLTILLGACGGRAGAQSLYARGLEVVSVLEEMARSDEYLSILSASGELREILSEAGQGNFSRPKAVYRIRLSADAPLPAEDLDGMSDALRESIRAKTLSAVVSQVNALGGVETLAASSVCTAGTTFAGGELEEDVIYVYTYEDAVPAAVTFIGGEDGTVSATGMFVLYDGFHADSEADVGQLLAEFGVEVDEVGP